MAFSSCTECGEPSKKAVCDACIKEKNDEDLQFIAFKLNEAVAISGENIEKAATTAKKLMEQPAFVSNEAFFWSQVTRQSFLEDCYYHTKLGTKLSLNKLLALPDTALRNIPDWFSKNEKDKFALKTKLLYDELCEQENRKNAELKKAAEEKRIQDLANEKKLLELADNQKIKNQEIESKKRLDLQRIKIAKILSFASTIPIAALAALFALFAPIFYGVFFGVASPLFVTYLLQQANICEKYNDKDFESLYFESFNLFMPTAEKWASKVIEGKNAEWMVSMCLFQFKVFIVIFFSFYLIKGIIF